MSSEILFNQGDYVVYPSHGVGVIEAIEVQTVADMELKLIVIAFNDDQMKLRLPIAKAKSSGLRLLSSLDAMEKALQALSVKTKTKKAMWSKRAQEYDMKINSGDPLSICEVIRDLYKPATEAAQSYSERQMFESAVTRLCRELAIIENIEERIAQVKVAGLLQRVA